ncbi:MAG: bifunctional phosphoribosylaminoimidazolecarboxamide formyltransferase/IMP cyclohydrolase [Longimicrobiales bacterium]|nr:bifunctional phosphoribosylaminoimidazolecarboxamide formyltransferase/IMP cyclohydrolase [Longimicrobiales bacterium]
MTSPSPRALLSVSDKTGVVEFARALAERGWHLLSTGGTATTLRDAGLEVTEVAEVTGHREMMAGRVKTLHPAIHAGLLARRDALEDMRELAEEGYAPIDLVAVNLYPFRQTIAREGVTLDDAMAKVDIGGPTMIRAAAKNHSAVTVVVDPGDYSEVLSALDAPDTEDAMTALRRRLAAKVFRHISSYDRAVADYLESVDEGLTTFAVEAPTVATLRYGENPDQAATFHRIGEGEGIAGLEQLHGKALSYNNILDLDGALLSLAPFAYAERAAVCIVKHTTPCGLAVAGTLDEAYRRALATDPLSSFGSVIAVNRVVDAATAEALSELFVECLVAPDFDDDAFEILTRKKNLRLLRAPRITERVDGEPEDWHGTGAQLGAARFIAQQGWRPEGRSFRSVYGGVLVQEPPRAPLYGLGRPGWEVVTRREPTEAEWDDLAFAWGAVYGVKSNAIVLARDGRTLGIGAGQMSRVDSSRIAVRKAADASLDLAESVLASDAFFPFRDGVDAAAEAGARAIVQPGGSIRDEEVVAAADEHGIAMVFTGRRLFRH